MNYELLSNEALNEIEIGLEEQIEQAYITLDELCDAAPNEIAIEVDGDIEYQRPQEWDVIDQQQALIDTLEANLEAVQKAYK